MVNLKKATFVALTALISFSYALPEPVLVNLNTLGSGVVVVGGLYRPDDTTTAEAAIAVFVMHTAADYIAFPACTQLAARGYTVLCADDPASLYSAQQADIDLEGTMLSVAVGVEYLQNLTEISKVVLFGHSGGGGVMSAYQNIAENGLAACNGSEKLLPCPTTLADLTPADGVMLIDPVYGISTQVLLSMGAEIVDETNGMERNASLSVYNTANGFNATGSSKYTTEFTKAFMSAVAKRMQRVVKYSQERIAAIDNGTGLFIDDEDLYIPDADYGQQNNKLYPQDTGFLSRTVHAWPLLHANESITTSVIHTVRVATNFGPSEAASYTNGALKTSVRRFLGAFAMTVTDDFGYNETSFVGIQWNSSHMVPNEAVRGIKSPLLTMGMTGYWLFPNCEMIYLNSGSNDTSIVFVEGAQHNIDTCTACETYSDQYGNTTKTAYDYMASWLGKEGRFL